MIYDVLVMKLQCIHMMLVVAAMNAFGQLREVKVGASIGTNLSLTGNLYPVSGYEIDTQPGVGWNAAATASCEVAPRIRTSLQLGGLVERFSRNSTQHLYSFYNSRWIDRKQESLYSWAEGTLMFVYLSVVHEKFALLTGAGLTTRRLIKATEYHESTRSDGTATSPITIDITDKMHTWNYLLPLSVGAVFDRGSSGALVLSTELHLGLRDRFESYYPPLNVAYDYGVPSSNGKLYSLNLKLAFLLPVSGD